MDRKDLASYMTMAISYTSLLASTPFVGGSPGGGERDGLEGPPLKRRQEGRGDGGGYPRDGEGYLRDGERYVRDGERDLLLDRADLLLE